MPDPGNGNSAPQTGEEAMDPQKQKERGRLMVPMLVAHVVCCGGLMLVVFVGSAGFAAIAAFARDPVVQAVALAGAASLLVVLWSRRRTGAVRGTGGERSRRTG
ncbi:MAG: hypothetical protein IIC13_15830 [SAR324 cluster bacterium]|nr:hypothetical protein [SAR324 cluster bacterium]MCH8888052.1 hypothetical protein [SAR324 cluster bacterium]